MLLVHGQPLESREVEQLIRALSHDGRPLAAKAAGTILHAYVNDRFAVLLGLETREAVCSVLAAEEELSDGLEGLHEALSGHGVALAKIM